MLIDRSRIRLKEGVMAFQLTDIPGIGDATATLLGEHGIDSFKQLRKGGVSALCMVPGFGQIRATRVLAAADALKAAAGDTDPKPSRQSTAKADKKGKTAKKSKAKSKSGKTEKSDKKADKKAKAGKSKEKQSGKKSKDASKKQKGKKKKH